MSQNDLVLPHSALVVRKRVSSWGDLELPHHPWIPPPPPRVLMATKTFPHFENKWYIIPQVWHHLYSLHWSHNIFLSFFLSPVYLSHHFTQLRSPERGIPLDLPEYLIWYNTFAYLLNVLFHTCFQEKNKLWHKKDVVMVFVWLIEDQSGNYPLTQIHYHPQKNRQ